MEIVIESNGDVRCVYAEAIDLNSLGPVSITRGAHVEPDDHGRWLADLAPVNGPRLGPFPQRSDALKAEADWLTRYWLTPHSQ